MIFIGNLFNRNEENEILKQSKVGLSNADNTLQWNIIDGLIEEKQDLKIINLLPVGTYPKKFKKLILKDKLWEYKKCRNIEIGSINLPILKQLQRTYKLKKILKKSNDKSILVYSLDVTILKALYALDESYDISLIVTDLPEFYDMSKSNRIRKFLMMLYNLKIPKYLKRINKFILLTEEMKNKLEVGERPYIIMEGCCRKNKIKIEKNTNSQRIIFYSGALNYKYGIKELLEVFHEIDDKEYKLWICGAGEAENEIKEYSEIDDRITFFGYVSKENVEKLQKKSTILINPRKNNGEYTKYSFPSKTIEYLSSGKPVIMYKLDGIPNEYDDYLFYVDGNLPVNLKEKIIEVCSKSNDELFKIGIQAQSWVIKEKNYQTQAKRIISLIKQ